jgi:hypothetical protein
VNPACPARRGSGAKGVQGGGEAVGWILMLLVGTKQGLLDLDTGHALVDGHTVTALASGPRGWHALLDRQVVIRLDDGEVMTVGELPADDGQSLLSWPTELSSWAEPVPVLPSSAPKWTTSVLSSRCRIETTGRTRPTRRPIPGPWRPVARTCG